MAAGTRLKLALALAVLLAHLAVLDEFARALQWGSALEERADPMFTRVIRPEPPPQPPPKVAGTEAARPPPETKRARATRLPASAPQAVARAAKQEPPEAAAGQEPAASSTAPDGERPPPTAASDAQPAASGAETAGLPQPAASGPVVALPSTTGAEQSETAVATASATPAAPAPPASAAGTSAVTWPTDTRLSYRVSGIFREGQLYGDAQVQWQRENDDYQVRVEIDITLWAHMVMTSQGTATHQGLVPRVYEEARRGKRRGVQFGERAVFLDNGRVAPRPEGVQDTASQFVELAWRFATGRDALEVGRSVRFWMARPGAVDDWTYDIVDKEVLRTRLGEIEAFHLKPRPIANPRGNITAEMWFAPQLQYLPVRIKVSMGEAYVDLLVEKIEQR